MKGKIDMIKTEKDKSTELEVSLMSRAELVDFIKQQLSNKHVGTLEDFFDMLKNDKVSDVFDEKGMQVYLTLLREELSSNASKLPRLSDREDIGKYLATKYANLKQEEFHVICMDCHLKMISDTMVAKGTIDRSCVDMRAVFRTVFENNAKSFIIAHNHPSGNLNPSSADLVLTKAIDKSAALLKIEMLDSIIVGDGNYQAIKDYYLFE